MYEKIKSITKTIEHKLGVTADNNPIIGIIIGSGLSTLLEQMNIISRLNYHDIEHFPHSTVEGHQGEFIYGTIYNKNVIAMQGRIHYYEGYDMEEVVLPVRVMCMMGIKTLIVSNAAGGLNPNFKLGDIMIINDHINLLPNPLIGLNDNRLGPRFPSMSGAYDQHMINIVTEKAGELNVTVHQGVYLASSGPTFETKAEYRYFKGIGADACGMSTAPEVIIARHMNVKVLGVSIITNEAWRENIYTDHNEVQKIGLKSAAKLSQIIFNLIKNI